MPNGNQFGNRQGLGLGPSGWLPGIGDGRGGSGLGIGRGSLGGTPCGLGLLVIAASSRLAI